jgi:CheY-like chemotaxis protein
MLTLKESGGPAVRAPTITGFGTKIITASFSDNRRGRVDFDWQPEGLAFTLKINLAPGENLLPLEPQPSTGPAPQGRRLLLVEDEPIVGIYMQTVLDEMGFVVVEVCRTLQDGLAAARQGNFDGAILDMNLGGVSVYPLADLLVSQGVPFLFATGYSGQAVDKRFAGIPIVEKPVEVDELSKVVSGLFIAAGSDQQSWPEHRHSA